MKSKHDDTKERILKAGMQLVPLFGYNATGLEAILTKAAVPKGSFYHYFRTKQDFGLELLARFVNESLETLDGFLNDATKQPLARLEDYIDHVIDEMERQGCSRGCFVGNLSQELSDQNEAFRQALARVFEQWQEKIANCLATAQECSEVDTSLDVRVLARFFFSALEGAILQAKVLRSVEPLRDLKNMWRQCLRG
ncbi:MAG: TetR family transcriptional regulator C-terminal domain-containing protein [Desulfovibrionaceae bacterium]|nr:TetR family transcriptional regulator C-terminal domain-containing protein [Desulfovibrionaceae bacterium]